MFCQQQEVVIFWLIIATVNVLAIGDLKRKTIQKSNTSSKAIPLDQSCSIASFDSCLSIIQEVSKNNSLAFPTNRQDLNQACKKLKEGDICAENHMKNCTNRSQKMLFQEIVKGSKQVLKSLCETGDFQNNYLRYAQCFKNVSLSDQKCATVLKKVQNMTAVVHKSSNVDEELKKFCCAFKESVDCQIEFVRRDCGERAVVFFEKYLKEMSSSLMHQHCASYTFSDSCNPRIDSLSQSSHMNNSNHFLIIIVFIIKFTQFLCNYSLILA